MHVRTRRSFVTARGRPADRLAWHSQRRPAIAAPSSGPGASRAHNSRGTRRGQARTQERCSAPLVAGGVHLGPLRGTAPARSQLPGRCHVGRLRLPPALLAQLVEHFHGKEGVNGSSPLEGFVGFACSGLLLGDPSTTRRLGPAVVWRPFGVSRSDPTAERARRIASAAGTRASGSWPSKMPR